MLRDMLAREGVAVGRRHMGTLMRRMGIQALYRKPNTSKPQPGHKVYPYLLRGVKVNRANQVWATDITYVPMARGWVYLCAIVDWASRRVLAHRVSITMDAAFCVEALQEAFARYGQPEIFNSDQGSQFTSDAFPAPLLERGMQISMDGRGAWRDNVLVERLWRSIKYEEVYLTYARRIEMVRELTVAGLSTLEVAARFAVTPPTVRKWLGRYLAGGEAALADASSRPAKSPRAIDPGKALLIVELRQRSQLQARIAKTVGVSESTVSRVLMRAGLSKLSDLAPREPVQRYEHAAPGDLLHIDTKKLGRIERPSHRVTGNRRDSVDGAGWETLFVAIDDHARIAFTAMHPDEKTPQAVQFLKDAVGYYARLGVKVKRLLTDNGSAFRSKDFGAACKALGITHKFTRPYRPQTNGKAERFIQSALREWAYGWTYQNSAHRTDALSSWQHHYNWHRTHSGIGGVAPMSRLPKPRNNLLTVHT